MISVGELDKKQFPTAQVVVKGNVVGVVSPLQWEAIAAAQLVAAGTKWADWKGLPGSGNLSVMGALALAGVGLGVSSPSMAASVANAVELGFPLLRPGGCVVAWKRLPIDEELAAARRAVDALGGGTIEVVRTAVRGLDDHVLAIATKRGRTATHYPRDPADRARRPW